MSKIYFDHISETIKARDLIFGTCTHYGIENKMSQSGYQVEPSPQMAPPTLLSLKTCFGHNSETNKPRDLISDTGTP